MMQIKKLENHWVVVVEDETELFAATSRHTQITTSCSSLSIEETLVDRLCKELLNIVKK